MNNSRTKKSLLTMFTGSVRQILTVLLAFVSRTIFIYYLGAEYLGLNGLFSNILSILALSELGIGSAISFYLYKPLADHNKKRIQLLMNFYKICYRYVGIIMIILGSVLIPFLPKLVKFDNSVAINLYIVYFLYLLNSASSYLFFAYKQALVTANQEQYKIEKINIIFVFINCIMDIIVIMFFKNYLFYLVEKFILVLVKNLALAILIDKEYPFLKDKITDKISKNERKHIFNDVGKIALFRIGSTLFNATDNIIISLLLGTVVVGYYSNYYMIISQVTIVISIIVRSITAGIGNVIAKENTDKQYNIYKQLDFAVYIITSLCAICLFQLLNSFVKIWIGQARPEYILSQMAIAFLVISFYFDNTVQVMNGFREGSGKFNIGKFLQIIGGFVNIILSLLLGKMWGIEGVFLATIISKACITVVPFIIGISQNVFYLGKFNLVVDYIKKMSITMIITLIVWVICFKIHMTSIYGFLIEIIMTLFISIVLFILFFARCKEMCALKKRFLTIIGRRK